MTIPGLQSISDESRYVGLVRKAYSDIQASTSLLETKYGESQFWPWSNEAEILKRYESVMNTAPYSVGNYDISVLGGDFWAEVSNDLWFQTADGMVFRYAAWKDNANNPINIMYVDVNGNEGPNRVGVDVHAFFVNNKGVFPLNAKIYYANASWACTYYVIKTGKMPWLEDSSYTDCSDSRIDNI